MSFYRYSGLREAVIVMLKDNANSLGGVRQAGAWRAPRMPSCKVTGNVVVTANGIKKVVREVRKESREIAEIVAPIVTA